jgi:restriction endonuclease S subunit
MKTDSNKKNKVLDLTGNTPPPRPIAPRECKCGCGYTFQPARRDQVYLNKQHADFGYNHNTRSIKNLNRNEVGKILSSNDKVLEKYFKAHRQENCAICYLDALKADGFNKAYHIGKKDIEGDEYFYSYNYYYHIYVSNNIKIIKVYKR